MIFPFLDSGCVIFLRWSSVLAFNSSSRLCAKLFRSVSSSPTMMCRIVIRSLIPALKRASYFFLPFLKKSLQELDTKKNGVLLPHLNWKYSIPTSQSLVEFKIFYTVLCFGDRLILRSAVSLSLLQMECCQLITPISLFTSQMFRLALFFSSTSSDLSGEEFSCYFQADE